MKCPERFTIVQNNINRALINEDLQVIGNMNVFIESQNFGKCYKDDCAAWDKENKRCRKVNE